MKRIRGVKNNKSNNNSIYLTPQKRKNYRKTKYDVYGDKNQSTAAITEGNSNIISNNKNIVFNTDTNKNKFKEISQRLNMEMSN